MNPGSSSRCPPSFAQDYLSLGLFVTWEAWDETLELFARERGRTGKNFGSLDGMNLRFGNMPFSLSGRGKSLDNGGGPYYEFVLKNEAEGIELLLAKKADLGSSCANVRVTLQGRFFLRCGDASYGWKVVRGIIGELGGTIRESQVSRVDLALDLPGVATEEFVQLYKGGCYISRAKSDSTYISNCTTLYFGKRSSAILCRIYDKLCHALGGDQQYLMMQRRWGGSLPLEATRVEFMVRRKSLKKYGILTMDDLFLRQGDLLDYLTKNWLRFTVEPVDRSCKNHSRSETHPLWKQISREFITGAGGMCGEPLPPIPPCAIDVSQLGKQAVGVILKAAREQGVAISDAAGFYKYATELMQPYVRSRFGEK